MGDWRRKSTNQSIKNFPKLKWKTKKEKQKIEDWKKDFIEIVLKLKVFQFYVNNKYQIIFICFEN